MNIRRSIVGLMVAGTLYIATSYMGLPGVIQDNEAYAVYSFILRESQAEKRPFLIHHHVATTSNNAGEGALINNRRFSVPVWGYMGKVACLHLNSSASRVAEGLGDRNSYPPVQMPVQ